MYVYEPVCISYTVYTHMFNRVYSISIHIGLRLMHIIHLSSPSTLWCGGPGHPQLDLQASHHQSHLRGNHQRNHQQTTVIPASLPRKQSWWFWFRKRWSCQNMAETQANAATSPSPTEAYAPKTIMSPIIWPFQFSIHFGHLLARMKGTQPVALYWQ